jgi:hypothetical protein
LAGTDADGWIGCNQIKNRKGACREDRYHTRAVSFDEHLFKRTVYIDMNIVRTGVMDHLKEWHFYRYNEKARSDFRTTRPTDIGEGRQTK